MGAVSEVGFLCELGLLLPHIECPTGARAFCSLFPLEHQYCSISVQLKPNIFLCLFCSALILLLRNSTLLCIFLFYMSLLRLDIFYKTFCIISSITHTCQWTHFVQEHTFITHNDLSLWGTKHCCVSLILQCMYVERLVQTPNDWPCIMKPSFPCAQTRH